MILDQIPAIDCANLLRMADCRRAVVLRRENNPTQNNFRRGFLTRILRDDPFPPDFGQWDNVIAIRAVARRTHTAARPSRIFTVFPFEYPAKNMPDLKMFYFIIKEHPNISKAPLELQVEFY